MDWKKMLKLSPRDLDDQQKDELCQDMKWMDIDVDDLNLSKLKILFNLAQEIMKYKDEQVEMLISEFDEMAKKQGIEEARIIQNLENEIKSLKFSSGSRQQAPDAELTKENNNLKHKIRTLKTNIKIQMQEIDELKSNIIILQEENRLLQLELHNTNRESDSQSDISEISEKHKCLTENIKQKNKQISQLLSDIEVIEKENILLKEKIVTLRDELNEATEHISTMTPEIFTHQNTLKLCSEKNSVLYEENSALRNQIKELVQQSQDRENEIEMFTTELDAKIEELKSLLEEKQAEILNIKQENNELKQKLPQFSEENKIPITILMEKEEQIEELQTKLIEATQEIEKNTILLNNISESRKPIINNTEHNQILEDLKLQLLQSHERCQELQKLLESAEEDAQNQGQQLAEVMNQLHKYEEGQYGLADAIKEIQEYRIQINIRDKQISQLIQEGNKLQSTCDQMEQENLSLREKLGLPLDVPVLKTGIISKQRKQKKLINNLQNQIEILEDEKLQIKVDLQKFKRLFSEHDKLKPEVQSDNDNQVKSEADNKERVKELTEENESLRKGMHEILDSIREKKDTSSGEIKCESLEKLLHILDARHVTGWYHPAMKLQAEVNTLQGTNEELRNQLKLSRSEINKSNDQLLQTQLKLQELQKKVQESTEKLIAIDGNVLTSLVVPPNISATSAEIISKLNSHLLIVLNEYHSEMEVNDKLKDKLESFKQEINIIRQQIGLLYKQHIEEKKILTAKYDEAQAEKQNLSQLIDALQNKLENYLKTSENENIGQKLSNDLVTLNRKCLYLEENEKRLSAENIKLKSEMCYAYNTSTENIKDLEISQSNLNYKLNILENTLRDSVPKNKLENANKVICDLTTKYRELLQNINQFKETNNVLLLKKEIELLNTEKDKLFFELLQLKSKSYLTEHSNDEIVQLTKKLANFELNELSERQRADHINSLYILVKEQLKKCEERCTEYENQSKLLLNANLKLQLVQQELQDKLINSITPEEFETLKDKLNNSKEELHNLKNKYERLQTKNNVIETEIKTRETLKSNQMMELMSLKHLLLDLQSSTDEKALIARLSTEVVLARVCETDAKNRVDIMTNEIQQLNEDRKQKDELLNEIYAKMNSRQNQFQIKCRILEQIITSLRSQYLGCNPINTQERIIEILRQIYIDKQHAFNELQVTQKQKNDIIILQEQLNTEIKNTMELKSAFLQNRSHSAFDKILDWYRDKHKFQIKEVKHRRNLEFKETELQQALERIKNQDNQLFQLEEELLKTNTNFLSNLNIQDSSLGSTISSRKLSSESTISNNQEINKYIDCGTDPLIVPLKIQKTIETQTSQISEKNTYEERILTLQDEIKNLIELISLKENNLQRQQKLISECEQNVESLKKQLIEKEKQIVTENVNKEQRNQVNVIDEVDMGEHNALKKMVSKLQFMITQKEDIISKYETLLKEGKDEHSLAASRFQEEIKQLQIHLQLQQEAYQELNNVKADSDSTSTDLVSNKIVLEQFVKQVHVLEGHMAELQTSVSSLNSQLQASRQESVRWKTLANDRLNTIENLRKEFNNNYEEEINMYRNESEKYKEENITLKQELSKMRVELNQKTSSSNQEIQEKDTKIHELSMNIMQLKNDLKLCKEDDNIELSPEFSELELAKQLLETEYATLKKRYDQMVKREKSARDDIRKLKGQLIKRPVLSVRSDRSERSVKEQLQKKIAQLETDLNEANQKLEREAQFNETRKLKVTEDFTQWEKMKKWQQTAEKLKLQLSSKTIDLDKVQQSYNSAKSIISRLEREKHILEGKIKSTKNSCVSVTSARMEVMEQENIRLQNEIDALVSKLEMQQYHSGGLGAAMLQEKLEAQERKIAVLELSTKGSGEVTAELERLNNTITSLQKVNLRLEAENLELNLDLKKAIANGPYLREQIQHLERYIDALKSEQSDHHVVSNDGDHLQPAVCNKKELELKKTVFSLKRLVEKLHVENKRLQSRPSSSNSDRKVPGDKLQVELKKVREQYSENVERFAKLEDELTKSQKRVRFLENVVEAKQAENESTLSSELTNVKEQLAHKSQLLDKVKILLQKAAVKEKFLLDQVDHLKALTSHEGEVVAEVVADKPAEEEEEANKTA